MLTNHAKAFYLVAGIGDKGDVLYASVIVVAEVGVVCVTSVATGVVLAFY
jgi:hypothetical protein